MMTTSIAADLVAEKLREICEQQLAGAASLHPRFELLWQTIYNYLMAGGKRVRPFITLLVYEAYSCKTVSKSDPVVSVATAWELLHASMLIHDDIIDNDYMRHGKPNIAGVYKTLYDSMLDDGVRTHAAMSSALLAGDVLLSAAQSIIASCKLPPADVLWLRRCMDQAITAIVAGELLDTEISLKVTGIDIGLIAELKTANYSIIAPLQSGAKLGGASDEQLILLADLGLILGRGYQLADDLLGVFGDEHQTGKSASSDLAEGKRTMVTVTALRLMTVKNKLRAQELLDKPSEQNVRELRQLISETPVHHDLQAQLELYLRSASTVIQKLAISDDHKRGFVRVAESLLKRDA